jgi:hypothetical protein
MKAIAVTDQAAGTTGMKLVERPEPQAAINDVVVGAIEGAREIASSQIDVASHLDRFPRQQEWVQFAPSLQCIGYDGSNSVTGRGSQGDPNGERVPQGDMTLSKECASLQIRTAEAENEVRS